MRNLLNILKLTILTVVIFFIGNSTFFQSSKITNENLNKKMSVNVIAEKQKEIKTEIAKAEARKKVIIRKSIEPIKTFFGTLTGYSADCPGFSGNLACTGTSVKENGVYYNDKKYGKIRIVATSSDYPCGTIIRFNHSSVSAEPIVAIALDRGVSGNKVDLLSESSSYAIKYIGSVNNKKFEVLRLGW